MTFDGVQTVYDVDYDYDDFKGRGSLLTWYKQLQFEMEVIDLNNSFFELTLLKILFLRSDEITQQMKLLRKFAYTILVVKTIILLRYIRTTDILSLLQKK